MLRSKWMLSVAAAGLLAMLSPAAPAFATADAACQPVFDSAVKVHAASAHVYNTEKLAGGKTRVGELIYANGIIYILVEGKWIRSKMTRRTCSNSNRKTSATQRQPAAMSATNW